MRIAYVDVFQNLPANSGNDWYTLQLVSDLSSLGDVQLFYTLRDPGKRGYLPSNTVKLEYIDPKINWNRLSVRLQRLRPEMLLSASGIKSVDADVVFARVYSYHIARHIAKANDAPIVIVMHNVEWQYLKHTGYTPLIYSPARLYENCVLRKADAVTTISAKDRDYAVATSVADKVFYVPYEPDTELFRIDRSPRHDYGADKLNVLFYGSLDRRHNVEALEFIKCELLPKLKERGLLASIRINVFGSGRPPKSVDLEKDPDIHFIGEVENPIPFIAGADVVIVPVRNPSGVKIRVLESLACKKPVIAFPEATYGVADYGGADELIEASTADAFVEALKSLMPPARHSLRADGIGGVHPLLRVDSASDAARYALEGMRIHKKG